MKIGCLQFDSRIGDVDGNVKKADSLLREATAGDLDLLVLPELAFTGYNFPSIEAITPCLEPTAAGISTRWACETAKRLKCIVIVGYPEIETPSKPTSQSTNGVLDASASLNQPPIRRRYNSVVTASQIGEVIGHSRKSHLYYTDAPWATEGPGFHAGSLPIPSKRQGTNVESTKIALGICMDINPYAFLAPFSDFEFANHALRSCASLVIISMAWSNDLLTHDDLHGVKGSQVDLGTLGYWVERFEPLVEKPGEQTILVMANRCGSEPDALDSQRTTFYTGSSTVIRVGNGHVETWGFLGKADEKLLVVDTDLEPSFAITS